MLCSDCKKNMAVIYINKLEDSPDGNSKSREVVGLCMECAKKRGIDPLANVTQALNNISPDDMKKLSDQFASMFSGANMESLASMFGDLSEEDMEYMESMVNSTENTKEDKETSEDKKTKVKKEKTKTKYLDTYGTNLTKLARENKLDKVIGREKELERLIQILNRRSKNNPALIGEPGVGKTAVINALALKIAEKEVPQKLMNKEVYLLDMTAMVAGTQFRGQFEARMKGVIDECKSYSNIILAIDELHNIVGGLDHDNSMNAGNMLKPALADGSIQVIGATTLKEYRKYIEKDTALERRFQPIIINEPSADETVEILKGIKHYYEEHHKVTIPNEILKDTVRLAEKYIFDRFFPDKAIDLLDEACSRVYLDNKIQGQIEAIETKLNEIEQEISETENEISDKDVADFEKAATLKATECSLKTKLEELNKKVKKSILTFENLAKVVELWTKIPVSRLTTAESDKLLNLEKALNSKIIGQTEAVHALSNAILRKRSNIVNSVRPPSFIFVGPTGVGKTALVKALAYELFDREDAIIRLDMSEYMESHSVSKLIGAPPGYVGFDDAGYLTEKVRRNPYSILLFDEIEKAHASVYNVLLQILEDGRLTDSQGKTVSFKNTIVILTSNLGTNFKSDNFGFGNETTEKNTLNLKVEAALKDYFSPEFLNRIDDTIIFNKLSKQNAMDITRLLLDEYITEVESKKIYLKYTENLVEFITEAGFNDKFGARPLRRAIQKNIEDLIAYMYIKGELKENVNYIIDILDNKVVLTQNSTEFIKQPRKAKNNV
ncbi:MAG: ATP-dependent Clp protease ATP-binding subunit [Clostridia bacterium]|nr:ATP-dependent Clp protease ATP-binding subunit [Clostridia bacterium]